MNDDALMDAATSKRRVALVRIEQGHWGTLLRFVHLLADAPDEHVDAVEVEVHGDPNNGNQGEARKAYEVLAYANELVPYGRPFHDFHTRLYAWVLLFSVHQMGTLEAAAKNFGRLRRAWPEAVFLSRRMAKELLVPFAKEAGMEVYLEKLIEDSQEAAHAVEEQFDARTVALTSSFRAPSSALAHRRARDAARITRRGLLPTAWCYGVIRAPRHSDLSRCFPRYPRWWIHRGVWVEMPEALSYLAHKLFYEFSAAWHVVNAEYYYFLAAWWVHTLMTDKEFSCLDATAIRRMVKLDLHRRASGPGGRAMLDTFHRMQKATEVFSCTMAVKKVIRRDTQTRAAGPVHIHFESTSDYGVTRNNPVGVSRRVPPGALARTTRANRRRRRRKETAGSSVVGRVRLGGLPVGLLRPAFVARCLRCLGRSSPLRPRDMSVLVSRTCGRRWRPFRQRPRCSSSAQPSYRRAASASWRRDGCPCLGVASQNGGVASGGLSCPWLCP